MAEDLAIERAKSFLTVGLQTFNRMPEHKLTSGYTRHYVNPNDTIMGMSLAAGGHLTHGAAPNFTGSGLTPFNMG